MLKPSIDRLLEITKSKFVLTEIIAKRATEIMIEEDKKDDEKEIELAIEEIYQKKVDFTICKDNNC